MQKIPAFFLFLLLLFVACTTAPDLVTVPASTTTPAPSPTIEEAAPAADSTGTPQLIEFYADW